MSRLLSPYNLFGSQLPNRVVMAPMTRTRAHDLAVFVQYISEFIERHNLLSLNYESLTRSLQQVLGPDADADGSEIVLPTKIVKNELDLDPGKCKFHLQVWRKSHTKTNLTVLNTVL